MFFCPCFFISIYVVCLMVGELLVKHLTFHCVSVDRTSTLWWTLLLLWRKKESVHSALIFLEMGKPLVLKGPSILFRQCLYKGIVFFFVYYSECSIGRLLLLWWAVSSSYSFLLWKECAIISGKELIFSLLLIYCLYFSLGIGSYYILQLPATIEAFNLQIKINCEPFCPKGINHYSNVAMVGKKFWNICIKCFSLLISCRDSKVPRSTYLTRGQYNGSKSKMLHHFYSIFLVD